MEDFRIELPTADVPIGKRQHVRIYGFADITPPMVELRLLHHGCEEVIRLTVAQAREIAAGIAAAADLATREGAYILQP
jgi:hypothetical protein